MEAQVGHRLAIELDDLQVVALLNEELGEHTHAGADLEDGQVPKVGERVGDAFGYGQVLEEVLAEVLLGAHLVVEGEGAGGVVFVHLGRGQPRMAATRTG